MGLLDRIWRGKKVESVASQNKVELKRKNEVERQIGVLFNIIKTKNIIGTSIFGAEREFDMITQMGYAAVEPLIVILKSDENVISRWAAAHLLGEIRDKRAVEPLIETLISNAPLEVRRHAAVALGKIGDERALVPLSEISKTGYNGVQSTAEYALSKINHKKRVETLIGEFKATGRIKNEIMVEPISYLLGIRGNDDSSDKIQAKIKSMVGELKEKGAFQLLSELLLNVDKYCQKQILEGLKDVRDESIVPILGKTLKTENDPTIRLKVAELLGKMGFALSIPDLTEALMKDENSSVRLKAAEALGRIRDASSLSALVQALSDKDLGIRLKAVESIGKVGCPNCVAYLNRVIENENENEIVRERAKNAVRKIEMRGKFEV